MRRVANRRTAAHDCDAAPKNVCAIRRVKTAMYCPMVGDCSKQNGKIVYAWNCMHYFYAWNKIKYERMIVNARDLEKH